MKFQADIGDTRHQVEIKREDGKLLARVDDREYELDASEPEYGVFLFKHEGQVYEAVLTEPTTAVSATHVRIGTHEFDIRLTDPKRLRGTGTEGKQADGIAEITTAMPGKVVRVLVEVGSQVQKGDGILVVEAMKMQNELKSPKAGVVKEIRAREGETVAAGDVLAMIE